MESTLRSVARLLALFITRVLGIMQMLGQGGRRLELAKEYPPEDEQYQIDRVITILKDKTSQDYEGRKILRGPHPKSNGLVRGEFTVESNLPDELRVGLFKEPRTYKAWIRFSNAVDRVTPDFKEDLRGLAIKLFDVEGDKILDDESSTHDFLFVAHDAFIVANAQQFSEFFETIVTRGSAMRFFLTHPRNLLNVVAGIRRYPSNLEIRWFSAAPFLFGERAVKHSLRPLQSGSRLPRRPTDDYLLAEMKERLATSDAYFDFMVQLQSDARLMPIENTLIPWNEKRSPFIKVASIKIPSQTFDSPEQRQFDENMSFNPWHCLAEHRPLGGVNRARRDVMKALSDFRLERNAVTRVEPTGDEQF